MSCEGENKESRMWRVSFVLYAEELRQRYILRSVTIPYMATYKLETISLWTALIHMEHFVLAVHINLELGSYPGGGSAKGA
jgi:hypothetical protein